MKHRNEEELLRAKKRAAVELEKHPSFTSTWSATMLLRRRPCPCRTDCPKREVKP